MNPTKEPCLTAQTKFGCSLLLWAFVLLFAVVFQTTVTANEGKKEPTKETLRG